MARRRYPAALQLALERSEQLDTRPRASRIEIILPFPPSVNNLFRSFVAGGRVMRAKSQRGKDYEETVGKTLRMWLKHRGVRPPLPPYRLSMVVYPPNDGRRHDLTNCFKAPEDALMTAIGGEDNNVIHVEGRKEPPDGHPRIALVLEGIGDDGQEAPRGN